ncbi:(2Fe-2S)-binding protein [Aquincola sp. MAHUQ-54]|uniref:(2Fe-2S)-binding protein n=1 Tax=Aquincola agrisoli TaxID=3119538 RepID=A0AAW9QNP8_9BURK
MTTPLLAFPPVATETIRLDVNGRVHELHVEPRTHLADALREHCGLTATHLGCEHGVCGACTVEVDGAPQRSCLQSAVRFVGKPVRTLEAFDDDPVMAELRAAFSAEHALQCGYCTPGMLMTARDIVLRLPHADDDRVREELAGNLCRCTGYQGIVQAIRRVLDARVAGATSASQEIAHAA